jgi:hypothetical protein
MTKQNNKYAPYAIVTLFYIIAVMFILGGKETTVGDRFTIVLFWAVVMGCVAIYEGR